MDMTTRQDLHRDIPARMRLFEITRAIGPAPDLKCLLVGPVPPHLVEGLKQRGGNWTTLCMADGVVVDGTPDETPDARMRAFNALPLPFDDKMFDRVVLVDALERFDDDRELVKECHRVLQTEGRIVVLSGRIKSVSPISLLRRLYGATPEQQGCFRPGYTEKALFEVLKSGFNVAALRTHTRFFVEWVDTVRRAHLLKRRQRKGQLDERDRRLTASLSLRYRLAYQLDTLLLLTRGFGWVAVGTRCTWRVRRAPVLTDTRTITEAVLSRPNV